MQTNKDYNMDVQYISCRRAHMVGPGPVDWFTVPFHVLSMITGEKGGIILKENPNTTIKLEKHKPLFLVANLKRKMDLESYKVQDALAFSFKCQIGNGINLLSLIDIPMFFNEKHSEHLRDLLFELHKLESEDDDHWVENIASRKRLCYEIVETLISSVSVDKDTLLSFFKNTHCTPAIEYLNNNYMYPLNIPKLMRLCNLSRTHFFRLFKKETNLTPFEYLKNCRIQEAQNMLLCTNLSVSEIGDGVGWPDPFHFSRMFKKSTSLSPQNYRQQHTGI